MKYETYNEGPGLGGDFLPSQPRRPTMEKSSFTNNAG